MDQAQLEQLAQGIAQALEAGEDPQAIAQEVAKQTGASPEEAMQLVEQVAQQRQGGGQGQGGGSITAEQAAQAFEQIGLTPEQVIQCVQIFSAMDENELQKLLQMIDQGAQQGEAPQGEPSEEDINQM